MIRIDMPVCNTVSRQFVTRLGNTTFVKYIVLNFNFVTTSLQRLHERFCYQGFGGIADFAQSDTIPNRYSVSGFLVRQYVFTFATEALAWIM